MPYFNPIVTAAAIPIERPAVRKFAFDVLSFFIIQIVKRVTGSATVTGVIE